jgi:hypothetical protein
MELMSESIKLDVALTPQTVTNSVVTGAYLPMAPYVKTLAVLTAGAMAAGTTTKLELFQGKTRLGTGSALIAGAGATIAANALVSRGTFSLTNALATHTCTVSVAGVVYTFTAHATVTTPATRTFSIAGDDTADAAELAICINDPIYGAPGVVATSALGVVTLAPIETGTAVLTIAGGQGTIVAATLEASAYVEIDTMDLTADHIAAKVTTTATTVVGVTLLRLARGVPVQVAGAAAVV